MAQSILQDYDIGHPAPHGGMAGGWSLALGLFAAPAAWLVQLLIDYGFTSLACFPREHPLSAPAPGWGWAWTASAGVNIAALLVALAGAAACFRIWRRSRAEWPGSHGALLDAGEGRTRFLAVTGFWAGIWFALAILFDTIAVFEIPLCGS